VRLDAGSVQSVRGEERRSGARRRQFRSVEQKRQMVQETLAPGASVAIIARRHGVNANQLFSWRRQYRRGVLELVNASASEKSSLVPVTVEPIDVPQERRIEVAHESPNSGRIDIEFNGARRVSVWGHADLETLFAILRELSRT
jgi:transposase